MSTLIVSLDDESLLALHARLDSDGPDDPAAVEAHHTVTTEMARRGIEHGHDGDAWSQAVILVESVEVDGPDAIEAPEELQKTWNATLSDGGTVSVLLTVDGYVLKADPTVSDVHVDTIMGGGRRRKLTKTEWKVGDFASWQSSGGTARGKILRIVRSGKINVPDSSFTISADEDDPAVLLEVWRRGPEGWAATDTKVGHKASTLTKLESLAKADGYTVPSGVQAAARQALKWIADGRAGDGFTSVGRARARQLADGGSVSRETLVKMRAYFARHIVDKEAKGWGDRSNPTPGMVAWYAWGGDAGRAWANRVLADDPVEKRATPEAILDLHVNLKNRQYAIDEYLYGPLNPDAPGNYWERLGAVWGVSAEEAQTTRCGNCAAFNVSPEILDAIGDAIDPEEGDDVVEAADLGYCEVFKFKCAAARSCSAWLTGGPIGREDDEDEIGFLESLTDEDKDWYAQISVRLDSGEDMDGVLLKRGNPEALRDYWRAGGKGRISWGAGGDFTSCVAAVGKYMTSEQAKGYCAIRHREVTGMWPGDKRNRETKKSVGYHTLTFPDGTTYSFTAAEPVLKHPGHPDQKVHAGRSASLSPEVARSIIERTRVNGGLSVNMVDGSEPPKGYMVARGGTRGVKPAIVDAEDFYDPVKGPQVLGDFLVTNRDTLTRGDYLGVWHDKQSGKVFLDVSENVMDRETAVRRGKRRDQISIWDVVNAEEIDTGGTGQIAEKSTDSSGTTAEFRRDDGGRDSSVRADALGEVSGQSVAKHGSHDQASHGRRGGGAATVPKMQADGPISSDRSTAAVSEAKALRAKAEAMEPAVTSMVLDRVSAYGGEMTGLEYRLKSTDSLARKIDADAVKEHDGDRTKAAGAVSDAIRYTATFDEDNYTDGVASTLGSLEADGYSVRAKNFWQPGDPYQGMNVKATKDGVTIELQFHTRNSVKIKEEKLHPLYEDYRSSTNNRDRWKAWDRMTRIAEGIPRPRDYERLLSIGTLTLQQFETAQQAGVMG